MTPIRLTGALSALALTLFLGACSTVPDNQILEPQFGTAEDDYGTDITYTSNSQLYVLSEQEGVFYDYEYGDEGFNDVAILRRFDRSGNLIWSREIVSDRCSFYYFDCSDDSIQTHAVAADSRGYSYSLVVGSGITGDCAIMNSHYVYKHDAAGKFIKLIYLGNSGEGFDYTAGASPSKATNITVDGSGNFYVVRQNADFTYDTCDVNLTNVIAKHSTSGSLLWQRSSTVGTLYGVSVSGRGDVYVAGSTGAAKYTNSGNLTWTKSGEAFEAAASGTNVYLRSYKTPTIRKLDANGKQLWSKTQSGLSGMVIGAMTADANGNVYLTGKYNASSSNRNIFTRKLNASGRVLWTKTFGTSAYDDARGIATINGSEIYLTGSTQGSLAHPYKGGDNDGYVRKLSSSGNPVWTR